MVMIDRPEVVRLSTVGVELNWDELRGGYVFGTPALGDDLVVYVDGKFYNLGPVVSATLEEGGASGFLVRTPNVPVERGPLYVRLPEGVKSNAALRR